MRSAALGIDLARRFKKFAKAATANTPPLAELLRTGGRKLAAGQSVMCLPAVSPDRNGDRVNPPYQIDNITIRHSVFSNR
jgi:hypothetical protein